MDRGYHDLARLNALGQAGSYFVTRAKHKMAARRVYSAPVDRSTGLICDQSIAFNNFYAARDYPEQNCCQRVRAGGHHQEGTEIERFVAYPTTAIVGDAFRKSLFATSHYGN